MKNINILFLLSGSLFLYACGSDPEEVAERFVKALERGEIRKAKKDATEELKPMIDEPFHWDDFKYLFVEELVEGNNAMIFFRNEKEPNRQAYYVDLMKTDGRWLVSGIHAAEKGYGKSPAGVSEIFAKMFWTNQEFLVKDNVTSQLREKLLRLSLFSSSKPIRKSPYIFSLDKEEIDKNKATVIFHNSSDGDAPQDTLALVKKKGVWYVNNMNMRF